MVLLAVNVMEKLRHLPRKDLANLVLVVLVVIIAILIIKQAAKMNRFVLFMILLVTMLVVGFTWVYQRNEPKILTPLVDGIAPFFPHRP
jgi:O-antigen ligase